MGCGFKEGPEEFYDKTKTVIHDVPKVQCSLQPQQTCKFVSKQVPQLSPVEECVCVPKEVCAKNSQETSCQEGVLWNS